jgi:hypothetical protein
MKRHSWTPIAIAMVGLVLTNAPTQAAATPGFDFFVDGSQDTDGDDRWKDLVGTTGFELLLDASPAVNRVAAVTTKTIESRHRRPSDDAT